MFGKNKVSSTSTNIDTLISSKVEIHGDVHFSGGVQIDGKVYGNVIASDNSSAFIQITEHGFVQGDIRAPQAVINGRVEGNVYSNKHLELAEKAAITGDVYYSLIEMVMGAAVNGNMVHSDDKIGETARNEEVHSTGSDIEEIPDDLNAQRSN